MLLQVDCRVARKQMNLKNNFRYLESGPLNKCIIHIAVLGGKERKSKSFFATAVPNKGASGRFASDKCIDFMRENGDAEGEVIVKTDQEPSIKFLVNDFIQGRPEGRTIPE